MMGTYGSSPEEVVMGSYVATRRRFFQSLGAAAVLARAGVAAGAKAKTAGAAEPARLNGNESPYGPFPSAVRAMAKAVERGNYYVFSESQPLRQKLAEMNGVQPANILLGVGSSEPLRTATEQFSSAAHPPVVAEPTFEAVAETAQIDHIAALKVPLTPRGVHDVERMMDAARKNSCGLFYLCNPNNPTGTIVPQEQVAWVVEKLPSDMVLLCDEAYRDFVDDPRYGSAVRYVQEGRNVIVLRTFSKIYGLAGMRLGYAIGPPRLVEKMRPLMLDELLALNQAVVAGAKAALEDKAAYDRVRTENAKVRRFVTDGIREMGYDVFDSQANCIMTELKRPIGPVGEKLAARGFLVGRLFPSLPTHQRITMGTMADMQRFLPVMREVLQG